MGGDSGGSTNNTSQCCYITNSTEDQINIENLLWELNEELVVKRIPAIIFVSILAMVGSFGNGLVMLTYRAHLHKSTVNVFIFWMSVCDFSLCFFEMPYKAFEIRFPLMYGYPVICKGFSFLEIFLSMVSIILLLCIAFDRYFVVQRPLQRLTLDNINKIITVCVCLGVLCSWPTLFVYGTFTRPTRIPGVYGWGCGVENHMLTSKVTPYWYYFLYAVFLVACVILITLYVRIWISIRRWKYTTIGESMCVSNTKAPVTVTTSVNATSSTRSKSSAKYETKTNIPPISSRNDSDKPCVNSSGPTTSSSSAQKPNNNSFTTSPRERPKPNLISVTPSFARTVKHARMRRNTLIFGAIASVFVLSYLPILVIIFLRTSGLYDMSKAPLWQAQLFEVLHRSGYINNAVNPFVYAFLSPWFRLHLWRIICD